MQHQSHGPVIPCTNRTQCPHTLHFLSCLLEARSATSPILLDVRRGQHLAWCWAEIREGLMRAIPSRQACPPAAASWAQPSAARIHALFTRSGCHGPGSARPLLRKNRRLRESLLLLREGCGRGIRERPLLREDHGRGLCERCRRTLRPR